MFCSRAISGSTNHYICHWITCNVRLNFCFLMILFWFPPKIKARTNTRKGSCQKKWAYSKNQISCLPKKHHFLGCLSYGQVICILLFQVELSIAFPFSQEAVGTTSASLLLWKPCRTWSKGNKALNKNINEGIIWREHENCFPSGKIYWKKLPTFIICPKQIIT